MDLEKYKGLFLTESQKQLDNLKVLFQEIEKNPTSFDKIEESMRLVHTLKGMAGMMSFDKLTKLSQQMEETLNNFCVNKDVVKKEVIVVLSKGLDILNVLVKDVRDNKNSGIEIDSCIEEIKRLKSI